MSMNLKGVGNKILSLIFILSILASVLPISTAGAVETEPTEATTAETTEVTTEATTEAVTEATTEDIADATTEPTSDALQETTTSEVGVSVSKKSTAPVSVGATTTTQPVSASYSNNYKVVTIKATSMYKGAGTKYAVVKKLSKGTALYITNNSSGNWIKVKDGKGTAGYVFTKHINKVTGSSVSMTCKTTADVNLRKGTSTSTAVLTVVPKGKVVSVISNGNTSWAKVKYGSKTGYLYKQYIIVIFKKTAVSLGASSSVGNSVSTPDTPTTTPNSNGTFKLKYTSASMYMGNYFQNAVLSNTTGESIKWSSSNTKVATIDSSGIIRGIKKGTVTITAKTSKRTAKFTLKVFTPSVNVNISNKTYTVNRYKTIYLNSSTAGANWVSLDTNKATVSGGLVNCKGVGKVVILAKVPGGWASCLVNIKAGEAVRFTYSNPNSAPKNSTVNFIAITDKSRSAVKFVVTKGKLKYTVQATSKKASGDTYIWTGKRKLTSAGSYSVVAYSKKGTTWSKSAGSNGKAFVTSVTSETATSCEERHASNKIISFISNYEGFLSKAIYDPLTSFPCLTVGYGRVVYAGESFYNNMTKEEAMAYLVESVEKDGYVTGVNKFLLSNKIKFNQHQFDSLVSLVYNCGPGILFSDTDIQSVLFNTHPSNNKTKGKLISKTYLRKTPYGNGKVIKSLSKGASVTLVTGKAERGSFYYVKDSSGAKGYISYKALSVTSFNKTGTRDLNNTIKNNYINNFFCYHHAGGSCYYGLLYRRIDECEIFFHGDYTRDGEKNKYNMNFACYYNNGFGC